MHGCACGNLSRVTDLTRLEPAVELLKALAAPVRLALVAELADGPLCVHELVERVGVSQPLTSQHLRVLRGAGLVTSGRRGREVEYALADDHVAHVVRDLLRHAEEPVTRLPHESLPDHLSDQPHEEPA
jgi:ArsR family transcriptional regulator, zinc-responsive transcriptional repressor